jgi:hypothetical protein
VEEEEEEEEEVEETTIKKNRGATTKKGGSGAGMDNPDIECQAPAYVSLLLLPHFNS